MSPPAPRLLPRLLPRLPPRVCKRISILVIIIIINNSIVVVIVGVVRQTHAQGKRTLCTLLPGTPTATAAPSTTIPAAATATAAADAGPTITTPVVAGPFSPTALEYAAEARRSLLLTAGKSHSAPLLRGRSELEARPSGGGRPRDEKGKVCKERSERLLGRRDAEEMQSPRLQDELLAQRHDAAPCRGSRGRMRSTEDEDAERGTPVAWRQIRSPNPSRKITTLRIDKR